MWLLVSGKLSLSSRDESIKEAGKSETEALGTQISIPDALRFRGVGPEHINSRLAMVSLQKEHCLEYQHQ